MAFTKAGTLDPHGAPVLRQDILSNTITFVVGDVLKVVSGFPTLATAGDVAIYGVLMEVETNKGVGVNTTGVSGALMGSYINSYLTSSTNQTVLNVRGITDVSETALYSAKVDAALGSTTGDNLLGYCLDLQDETQLHGASATTGSAQFLNWGVDPQNASNVIASVHESLVYGAPY